MCSFRNFFATDNPDHARKSKVFDIREWKYHLSCGTMSSDIVPRRSEAECASESITMIAKQSWYNGR